MMMTEVRHGSINNYTTSTSPNWMHPLRDPNNRSMDGMSQTSTLIQPEVVCAAILKAHGYKVVRPTRSNPRGTQSQSRSPGTITPITPTWSTRLDIVLSRDEGVLQDVGDRLRAIVLGGLLLVLSARERIS